MSIWMKAALVRAVRTMAQAAVAMIGTATVMQDIDWKMVASATVVSGILYILTSISGLPEVDPAEAEDAYDDDVEPVTEEDLDAEDRAAEEGEKDEA